MKKKSSKPYGELLVRYVHGILTKAGVQQLSKKLRASDARLTEFAETLLLDEQLRDYAKSHPRPAGRGKALGSRRIIDSEFGGAEVGPPAGSMRY
jgi:hypothetical protein